MATSPYTYMYKYILTPLTYWYKYLCLNVLKLLSLLPCFVCSTLDLIIIGRAWRHSIFTGTDWPYSYAPIKFYIYNTCSISVTCHTCIYQSHTCTRTCIWYTYTFNPTFYLSILHVHVHQYIVYLVTIICPSWQIKSNFDNLLCFLVTHVHVHGWEKTVCPSFWNSCQNVGMTTRLKISITKNVIIAQLVRTHSLVLFPAVQEKQSAWGWCYSSQ